MRVDARVYYGMIAAALVLSAILLYIAFTLDAQERRDVEICKYTFQDSLSYVVRLYNNTLFGKEMLKNPHRIFPNITKSIVLFYTFSAECSNCSVVSGSYEVKATLKTRHWNKTIQVVQPESFTNNYTITLPLQLDEYFRLYDKISRELNFESSDASFVLYFITRVESEHGLQKVYTHTFTMPLNRKVADVSTKQHFHKVETVKNTVEFTDRWKLAAKYLLAIAAIACITLALVFSRRFEPQKMELSEEEKILRKYRDLIVVGRHVKGLDRAIEVESFEELLKVAEFVNRPIVKIEGGFAVIIEGAAYVFKL